MRRRARILAIGTTLALVSVLGVSAAPVGAQADCPDLVGYNIIRSDAPFIRGTEGPDLICGGASANIIFGLGGDDVIVGGVGADVIWGGAGHDQIDGGGGPDTLRGGFGHDRLEGAAGNDTIFGGPGADVLLGGYHHDVLSGGDGDDAIDGSAGADRLFGGNGTDELVGGFGNDLLKGGKGQDRLFGDNGNDLLFGGTSHDTIVGGAGDDELTGGAGFDILDGAAGDDQIRGGNGQDTITGGDGDDRLNGGNHDDSVRGGDGTDNCLSAERVRDCANVADLWPDPLTDFGVTDDVIRVGMSADLSGPFAGAVTSIVEAQDAYFDRLNQQGGIDGRLIELVILDSGYDVPTHLDNYASLNRENADGVAMISHSTGDPHTSAIARDLQADDLLAIPYSWYSGWPGEDFGSNVFEMQTNYCFEAMNGVEFLVAQSGVDNPKLAIVSRPGQYGQDGATGARRAAEALGLPVVDLEGAIAGDDFTPIIRALIEEQPDIVWIASSPGELAQIFGGSAAGGLIALWSGNSPSYHPALLETAVGPTLDAFYFHSGYNASWGSNNSPGMTDLMSVMTAESPEATYAEADDFVRGWTDAMFVEAVLTQASNNGDLTRAGILAAANEVTVDFQGLAPNQTWSGSANDNVVRSSYIYDVILEVATPDASITQPGSNGLNVILENFVGRVAEGHSFTEACFGSE